MYVNGVESTKAYQVPAGSAVVLWDENDPIFYVKKRDTSGQETPMKRFRYVETARLMNDQTMALMSQSNANQINAIQGFNRLQQQIADLGYRMESCCCSIKTQMLQDRLDDAQATIVSQNAAINNANQSQYLLSQLGHFVAWNPEGTQALSAVTNTK